MLIDFRELFPRWNIKPKGVLHVGANLGEEYPVYMELGIKKQIWFEPNRSYYNYLLMTTGLNTDATTYCKCVGDENKNVILHISNNSGQSSSILELGTHKDVHPDVSFIEDIEVEMVRLDTSLTKEQFESVDFLNVDVQGAELLVLKGLGNYLHDFKAIYLEVNKAYLYVGCPLVEELDEYLLNFNFIRVETQWAGNTNWGDALYIKQ